MTGRDSSRSARRPVPLMSSRLNRATALTHEAAAGNPAIYVQLKAGHSQAYAWREAMNDLTRDQLVLRLAEVSHRTWRKQKAEDLGKSPESLPRAVTAHDLERAEDTVKELERLRVWPTR